MHFASNVPNAMCHWPVSCMLQQGTGQPHSAHHVYFKSNGACTSLLRMSVRRSRQIQMSTMFEDLITRVARVSEALHRERVHLREIPDAALESRNQIRRFDTFETGLEISIPRLEAQCVQDEIARRRCHEVVRSMRACIKELEGYITDPQGRGHSAQHFESCKERRLSVLETLEKLDDKLHEEDESSDGILDRNTANTTRFDTESVFKMSWKTFWQYVEDIYRCALVGHKSCACVSHVFDLQLRRRQTEPGVQVTLKWEYLAAGQQHARTKEAQIRYHRSLPDADPSSTKDASSQVSGRDNTTTTTKSISRAGSRVRFADDISTPTSSHQSEATMSVPMSNDTLCKKYASGANGVLVANRKEYVYDPPLPPGRWAFQSLHDILSNETIRILPSQRFELALALACSHLRLQTTQWLGQRWSSKEIMFRIVNGRAILSRPYLRRWSTRQSPAVVKRTRDTATPTLGVVLLELGFAKSITGNDLETGLALDVDREILRGKEWMADNDISTEAGTEYEELVLWCFRRVELQNITDKWRREMYDKVIVPLERLCRSLVSNTSRSDFHRLARDLQRRLEDALVRCQNLDLDGSHLAFNLEDEFCPDTSLNDIITDEATEVIELIALTLSLDAEDKSVEQHRWQQAVDEDTVNEQAEMTYMHLQQHEQSRKIFATLVLAMTSPPSRVWQEGWTRFISGCRSDELSIRRLIGKEFPLFDDAIVKLFSGAQPTRELWDLVGSRRNEVIAFRSTQYCFCAVNLTKEQQLKPDVFNKQNLRLPLIQKTLVSSNTAAGRVFRVKVHRGHFSDGDAEVAMKELFVSQQVQDEWLQTKWMLDHLTQHMCIMRATASLRIDKRVLLFYDWADHDLYRYMTDPKILPPSDFKERRFMFSPISELADALRFLHCDLKHNGTRMICLHKDLKPENILVTRRSSDKRLVLKLTDFGISSLKREQIDSLCDTPACTTTANQTYSLRQQPTHTLLGDDRTNSAPEVRDHGQVDASTDIWAFGTVLADYVAWLYSGRDGLQAFEDARQTEDCMFYYVAERTQSLIDDSSDGNSGRLMVKEGIANWYKSAIRQPSEYRLPDDCKMLESSWQLIRDHLLVCDTKKRAKIEFVVKSMDAIYEGGSSPGGLVHPSSERTSIKTELNGEPARHPRAGAYDGGKARSKTAVTTSHAKCWSCKQLGHGKKDCPLSKQANSANPPSRQPRIRSVKQRG
jgi:serine/threonine protein kinase